MLGNCLFFNDLRSACLFLKSRAFTLVAHFINVLVFLLQLEDEVSVGDLVVVYLVLVKELKLLWELRELDLLLEFGF